MKQSLWTDSVKVRGLITTEATSAGKCVLWNTLNICREENALSGVSSHTGVFTSAAWPDLLSGFCWWVWTVLDWRLLKASHTLDNFRLDLGDPIWGMSEIIIILKCNVSIELFTALDCVWSSLILNRSQMRPPLTKIPNERKQTEKRHQPDVACATPALYDRMYKAGFADYLFFTAQTSERQDRQLTNCFSDEVTSDHVSFCEIWSGVACVRRFKAFLGLAHF